MAKQFKLDNYFNPVDIKSIKDKNYQAKNLTFGNKLEVYKGLKKFKKLESFDILMFSFDNISSLQVRKELYSLSSFTSDLKIADLGFLKSGDTIKDKSAALREIILELQEFNKPIVILGENKFYSYSVYDAYEFLEKSVSITEISPMIMLKDTTA